MMLRLKMLSGTEISPSSLRALSLVISLFLFLSLRFTYFSSRRGYHMVLNLLGFFRKTKSA
jgi:hypothetical protein